MTKKRFNTNMEESKIIALKEVAEKEGMGANDLIEKLLDEYLERKNKDLQAPINLSTKLAPKITTELRREGLVLSDYKVLMLNRTRYIYKQEHRERYGMLIEEADEIRLQDNKTGNTYFVAYNLLKMLDEDKIEGLYFADTTKENVLEAMDYVYNEKYNNFEKEIFINGAKIKWLETVEFDNYRREKVLVYA